MNGRFDVVVVGSGMVGAAFAALLGSRASGCSIAVIDPRLPRLGTIRFDAADLGESELGHIVENDLVQASLWDRLQALPEVTMVCPATAVGIGRAGRRSIVDLDDGTSLRARLVVAADGAESPTRRLAGVGTRGRPDDLLRRCGRFQLRQPVGTRCHDRRHESRDRLHAAETRRRAACRDDPPPVQHGAGRGGRRDYALPDQPSCRCPSGILPARGRQ